MFYYGMYYEEAGTGKTVVLLHGWGGSIASFKGTAAFLSKFCRAVNLEFPGFGQSETPPAPYTVYDYAERVRELILSLGCGKATLIGHSFGGRIALVLAARYPDLIESAVLIDAAGLKPRRGIRYFLRKARYRLYKLLVKIGIERPGRQKAYGSPDFRALSGVMRETFINVVNGHLDALAGVVVCPVLIVWGSKDKDTPLYMAKHLKRRIAGSELTVFRGAGHYSYIDRFNACNALLKRWITKKEG